MLLFVHHTLFVFYPYNIFHQAFSFNEGEHFNAVQNRLNVPSASLNVICGGEDHLRSFSLSKQFFLSAITSKLRIKVSNSSKPIKCLQCISTLVKSEVR